MRVVRARKNALAEHLRCRSTQWISTNTGETSQGEPGCRSKSQLRNGATASGIPGASNIASTAASIGDADEGYTPLCNCFVISLASDNGAGYDSNSTSVSSS